MTGAGWEGGGVIYRNEEVTGRRCFGQGRGQEGEGAEQIQFGSTNWCLDG